MREVSVSRFFDYLSENGVTDEDFDSIYLFKRLLPDRQSRKLGNQEFFGFFEKDLELLDHQEMNDTLESESVRQPPIHDIKQSIRGYRSNNRSTEDFYENFSVDSDYQEMRSRICGASHQNSKSSKGKGSVGQNHRVQFVDDAVLDRSDHRVAIGHLVVTKDSQPAAKFRSKDKENHQQENHQNIRSGSNPRMLQNIDLNVLSVGQVQSYIGRKSDVRFAERLIGRDDTSSSLKKVDRHSGKNTSSQIESTSSQEAGRYRRSDEYDSEEDEEINDLSLKKVGTGSVHKRYICIREERRELVTELDDVKHLERRGPRAMSIPHHPQGSSQMHKSRNSKTLSTAASRQPSHDRPDERTAKNLSPRVTLGDNEAPRVTRKSDQNTPNFKGKDRGQLPRAVTHGHMEVKLGLGLNSFSHLPAYASNASTSKSPSPAKRFVGMATASAQKSAGGDARAFVDRSSLQTSDYDTLKLHSEPVALLAAGNRELSRHQSSKVQSRDCNPKTSDGLLELLTAVLTSETTLELLKSKMSQCQDFNVSNLFDHIDQDGKGYLTQEDLLAFLSEDLCLALDPSDPLQGWLSQSPKVNFCTFSKLFYPLSRPHFEAMRRKMYSYSTQDKIQLSANTTRLLVQFFAEVLRAARTKVSLGHGIRKGQLGLFLRGVLGIHGRECLYLQDFEHCPTLALFSDEVKEKVFETLDRSYCGSVTEDDLLAFVKT